MIFYCTYNLIETWENFKRVGQMKLWYIEKVGIPDAMLGESFDAPSGWRVGNVLMFFSATIWRRQWQTNPVLLPGKSHGWRSLVGCSPWGCTESDVTEWLQFHFSLSCTGEWNGNALQCSCLENPRDGGAWWAAVYGVAQSRPWLKRLSSSSSCYSELLGEQGDKRRQGRILCWKDLCVFFHFFLLELMICSCSIEGFCTKRQLTFWAVFSILYHYMKWKWKSLSRVQLFVTLWTVALQAPLSLGFSRQEYWSG